MGRPVNQASTLVIYEGATQSDLAAMFGMNQATVKAKIAGIRPCGQRNGYHIYNIREVAPYLVKFTESVVDQVLRMHISDMPKMLSKEYWMGRDKMLTVMQREGDLFTTRSVVELAGDAFKTLRLSLMLLTDAVEREVGLTPQQRDIITLLVGNCLNDMREKLVDGLSNRREHSVSKQITQSQDDQTDDL